MQLLQDLGVDDPKLESELKQVWEQPRSLRGWSQVYMSLRTRSLAPKIWCALWADYFSADLIAGRVAPIWSPETAKRRSNVEAWAAENGLPADEFHGWSVREKETFWSQSVDRLGIRFAKPATAIADWVSEAEQTRWFPAAELNIVDSCFNAADEAIAIVSKRPGFELRSQTYEELNRLVNRVANSVRNAGYEPGDRLAVVMPMTALSVAIYLGVLKAGCAIVSIADSFAAPEITTRLKISEAKAVFTYDFQERARKKIGLYERVVEATELPVVCIALNEEIDCELRSQDRDWDEFLAPDDEFESVISSAEDVINVLFSSGTTGDPKAIPWTHLTPIKCGIDGHCHQDIQEGDVCAWPTNLGWMMGPWLIFATLLNRGTIALFEDAPMGYQFGEFVAEAKVNMLGVVPTLVKTWRKSRRMQRYDWSAIRCFSSTGESSQRDDMVFLSALAGMKPIIEYCGGTEIGGGYISSLPTSPNFPAAFNSLAVGLDLVLLDEDKQVAEEGEVFLDGPSVGLSNMLLNRDHHETYFAKTPTVEGRGQLRRHGDHMVRQVPAHWEGVVYQAGGRVDDTMNLGGIKISSSEIERVLNQAHGVVETAAVAIQMDGGPSQLVVFVVLDGTNGETVAGLRLELNQRIRDELNPLFKIQGIEVVESLPRTASGKVMRRELRSKLMAKLKK